LACSAALLTPVDAFPMVADTTGRVRLFVITERRLDIAPVGVLGYATEGRHG
jgi:hypothetical protein